jgi:hypothetical protein
MLIFARRVKGANATEIETHLDNATRKKHDLFLGLTAKKKENSGGENRNQH